MAVIIPPPPNLLEFWVPFSIGYSWAILSNLGILGQYGQNAIRSTPLVEKCPNCLKRPTYSRPPWSVWISQKCPKVSNVPTYALNFENCQKVYKVAQKSAKSAPKRPKVSKGPNSSQKCPSCPHTWKVIKIVQFPRLFRSGQTAQKCWNRHKI